MIQDPTASYFHCEQQLRAEDHDAWVAALFAPAALRPHLHAIGAFAREAAHVHTRVRQPIAGEIRLQWWQDVIDGERATEAAAHPVAAALIDTMARCRLPAAPFGDLLDAHRLALYDEPPADVATLERRLATLYGTPIRLAALVLGGKGKGIEAAAAEAGVAIGLAVLLSDLARATEERGTALPLDLLGRQGVRPSDAGRDTPAHRRVRDELRTLARARLADLRARRTSLGDAAPGFLATALVEPALARPERDLPPWRRLWRLWRAARKGGVL